MAFTIKLPQISSRIQDSYHVYELLIALILLYAIKKAVPLANGYYERS